jgi:hypothetical protein
LIQKAHSKTITSDEAIVLANELEVWVDMALRVERSLHDLIKKWEGKFNP